MWKQTTNMEQFDKPALAGIASHAGPPVDYTLTSHITPAVQSTLEIPERSCRMLNAAMIEGAWKASPRATSEDGRDCRFRKAEWFEAPSAALARLVALDRTTTTTTTPAGLAFSPPYVAANGV